MDESLDASHMYMESQLHVYTQIYYLEELAYVIMEVKSVQDLQSTSHMPRRANDAILSNLKPQNQES